MGGEVTESPTFLTRSIDYPKLKGREGAIQVKRVEKGFQARVRAKAQAGMLCVKDRLTELPQKRARW